MFPWKSSSWVVPLPLLSLRPKRCKVLQASPLQSGRDCDCRLFQEEGAAPLAALSGGATVRYQA